MRPVATLRVGEEAIEADVALFVRDVGIGQPVRYAVTLATDLVDDEREGGIVARLAAGWRAGGAPTIDVRIPGIASGTDTILAAGVAIQRVSGPAGARVVHAQGTFWPGECLVPLRAAYRASTPADLFAGFSGWCAVTEEAGAHLRDALRSDGREVWIVQDGLSDRAFLERVLASLSGQLGLPTLAFGGALGREGESLPHLFLARGQDYPTLPDAPDDPPRPTVRWSLEAVAGEDEPASRFEGAQPCAVRRASGDWNALAWVDPACARLPWAGESGGWVCRVRDSVRGDGVQAFWERTTWHLPLEAAAPGRRGDEGLRSGMAWARVRATTPTGDAAKVELIEAEADLSILDARLCTSTSGKGGSGGLHLLPEVDSLVLVAWTGRLDETPALLGNVREGEVSLAAPSLDLDRAASVRLGEVEVLAVGPVVSRTDLDVHHEGAVRHRVDGPVSLALADALEVHGASATSRYEDTVVVEAGGDLRHQCAGNYTAAAQGQADFIANGRVSVGGDGRQLAFADGKVDVA